MNIGDQPVFPQQEVNVFFEKGHEECAKKVLGSFNSGLTIRQAYKMVALQGMLGNSLVLETLRRMEIPNSEMISRSVETSGLFADAMIQEDLAHEEKTKGGKANGNKRIQQGR